jgi:plastocyanin
MKKIRVFRATVIALIAGLLLCVSPGLVAAVDIPSGPPHAFYGNVLINGNPAPAGTKVEAKGTGVKTTAYNPINTSVAGKYGTPGAIGDKLIVQGSTLIEGTILTFYVNDIPTGQTAAWLSGEITKLDLSLLTSGSCSLTTASTAGGSVTTPGQPGPYNYTCGSVVPIVATADACHNFVNWTGNTATITNVNASSTTMIVNGSYSITANFALKQFTLTTGSSAGGDVTTPPVEGAHGPYNCGAVVNIVATATGGYNFVNWMGNFPAGAIPDVNNPSTTITMNGNYSIMAYFALPGETYTLTTSSTAGGDVTTPGEPGPYGPYNPGQAVTIVATATGCYNFVNWTGDFPAGAIPDVNNPSTTITMNGNYSIMANFAIKQFTLTTGSSAGGDVTTPPVEGAHGPYNCGAVVNIVATATGGYNFVNWTGAIPDVNNPSTTITMNGNYSITANFVQGVSVSDGGGGGGGGGNTLTTNLFGSKGTFTISSIGRVLETIVVTSPDGKLKITIPVNTIARDKLGHPLSSLTVDIDPDPSCPVPEDEHIIGLAYSFKPDGATFSPPIEIVFTYDPDELSEGVLEEELILAFCDEASGKWVQVVGDVNEDNNTITAHISHFTTYAIIGKGITIVVPPAPTPAPTPVPTPLPPKPTPAVFSPKSMIVSSAEVNPGETLTISVSVTNTGGEAGTHDVILKVAGVKESSKSISLNPGESKEVSFTISRDKPGTYQIECEGLSGSFVVKEAVVKPVTTPEVPAAPEVTEEGIQWWIWVIIAAVVLIGVGTGWYFYSRRVRT